MLRLRRVLLRSLIRENLVTPLRFLNRVYERLGSHGPAPEELAPAWLEWKLTQVPGAKGVRALRRVGPGKLYIEYDPTCSPVTLGNEIAQFLKEDQALAEWEKGCCKGAPRQVGRSKKVFAINWPDFVQDALIVMLRNSGYSYTWIAESLMSYPDLRWPQRRHVAVNRLKKRIPILRKAFGEKFLTHALPAPRSGQLTSQVP